MFFVPDSDFILVCVIGLSTDRTGLSFKFNHSDDLMAVKFKVEGGGYFTPSCLVTDKNNLFHSYGKDAVDNIKTIQSTDDKQLNFYPDFVKQSLMVKTYKAK